MKRFLPLSMLLVALPACDAIGAHTGVVSRVGPYELTVDRTVDMLVGNPRIPPTTEVVASVADLWVDYTILADLLARDTTLAGLNIDPLVDPYVEQRIFSELRDQIVTQDTVVDDDELRRLFAEQAPGRRVRARHILIRFPEDPSAAQRERIQQQAEELRERALAGEDFSELARRYSEDPGSAPQGGDLGWFEPGMMVQQFEQVAFRLEPGEISDVTETLFGLHIIQVDERETPAFDEQRERFRQQVVEMRRQESLGDYVESLTGPIDMRVDKGAVEVARDLAGRPAARLTPRAAARDLVSWRGGSLTAGGFMRFARRLPPQQRAQFAAATDEQLEAVLQDVATNELVLEDARRRGITVPQTERDSVRALIREQIVEVAQEAGLVGTPQEGEDRPRAVQRRVNALLEGIISGQQSLLPLGGLPYVLRQHMDWQIHERAFPTVVQRLEDQRDAADQVEPVPTPPAADPIPPPGELPREDAPVPHRDEE
jgi:peptidyl-prolyl cis-trans isomerase C